MAVCWPRLVQFPESSTIASGSKECHDAVTRASRGEALEDASGPTDHALAAPGSRAGTGRGAGLCIPVAPVAPGLLVAVRSRRRRAEPRAVRRVQAAAMARPSQHL